MAYRKSSWRQVKPSQVLPIWTTTHSNAATLVVQELFARIGVTDIRTYFQQLRVAIVICVIVCACIGASNYGLKGVFLGGLLGIAAPAAAIFLAVVVVLAAILLGVYCLAWVAIYYIACWLLGS